jgi:hypothetical protein
MVKIYVTGSKHKVFLKDPGVFPTLNLKYHTSGGCNYYMNNMIELDLDIEKKREGFLLQYQQCKWCFEMDAIEEYERLFC